MNKQNYIDHAEQALLHTYNRFPVVLDHGEGVYLYDTDGKNILILQQVSLSVLLDMEKRIQRCTEKSGR